jgi:transcription termination/antitermination protein NusG
MDETSPRGTNATEPETDEAAEIEARAEPEETAEVALEEAGGATPDETPEEVVIALEAQAEVVPAEESMVAGPGDEPGSDIVDVPSAEATVYEAEAEELLGEDTVEGVDAGPLFETGPDTYVQPGEEAAAEAPEPAEAAEPEPEPAEAAEPEPEPAEAAEPEPEPAEAAEPEPEGEIAPPSAFRGPGDWYVIHTYAGYENKVKANLHSRIGSMQMEDKIFDVVIPMEDVMEIKGGKKQVVQKKVFPGYLLVKMVYDNDSWYVVRNTPGVTGFVSSGTGSKPTPLSKREVEKILAVKQETQRKPEYRLEWEEGDVVRIIAGPFADFQGTIAEINVEQSKLKVLVNIFDRETPVELAFDQVAKA